MKLMNKRWISIIAIIALLTTMFCGAGAAAEETEEAQMRVITEKEEEFLLFLGVLKTPGPHQAEAVTRSGLAQIASRIANLPEYTGTDTYFSDVPTDHKHYKEVSAMAAAGIVNGDGNGKFRPDDPVTPNEICKIFAVILGYDVVGYYETYPVISNRIGLTDGLELSEQVTVGEMLKMALNTLDLPMMEQVTFGDKDEYAVQDGFTALERYHGLVKQRGIIEGVYGTKLSDVDVSIGKNQLIIGGRVFLYDNTTDLLGREIVFYSQRDKMTGGTKQQIEFLYEDQERNNYIEINGKDSEGLDENYFVYYEGSKERRIQMSGAPDVVLNGIAYPEYTQADLMPDCGTVILLDNNDDNIYDVIFIEEYLFMMVESIDQAEGILYGRYPSITIGSQNQEEVYQVYMEAGIVGELGYLSPGDVIAVQTSKNTKGPKNVIVTYLGEGTTGVIDGMHQDTYTIDGVPYEITGATAMDGDPYLIGQTVSLYTFQGHCAALIHPENDNYKFGFLIDAKVKETAFSGTLAVRIVNQDRELLELTAGEKFKLDESEYTDAFRALTQIKTAADKRIFSADMQAAADAASASTISRTDVKTLYTQGVITQLKEGETNFPYSQPVRYRVNNEGELTHLDTLLKGANETEQSLTPFQRDGGTEYAEVEAAMYSNNDKGFYIYDGSGSVFASLINPSNVIMPPYNLRDKVEYYGNGTITNEQYCAIEAYSVNEYRLARYAVVFNRVHTSVYEENQIYIIGNIEKILGEDGETVRQLTLYGYNGPYTRILSRDVDDSEVAVGNVVRYQVNARDEITVVETLYRIADGDPASAQRIKESGQSRAWGMRNRMAYGTALAFGDGYISHTTSVGDDVYRKEGLRNYLVSGTSFYRYTEESGSPTVELASSGDLVPYDTDPRTTQKAIMITYSNRLDVVYIIDK